MGHSDIMEMQEFPDQYFSLVLSEADPISYCKHPEKAVREMARVVRMNGFVIASVDSFFGTIWRMVQSQDFEDLDILLKTGDTTYMQKYIQHNFRAEELRKLYLQNGLEVVDIIAKSVFSMAIPWQRMDEVLDDKKTRERILELELKFNNDPNIVGLGNHLEIVGKKR